VLPGLRLSVDYTKLSKTDAIGTYPTGPQGLINDEAKYPGRITRGPGLAGDPSGWPGPIQVLDFTQFNLASATYEVIDGQISYELKLGNGSRVRAGGNATYQLTRDARLANGLPVQSSLGIASAGARSRFNGSLSWSKGPLLIGWNAQFTHSYQVDSGFGASPQNIVRQGNGGKVDGQIYHNLFAQYDFKVSRLEGVSRKIIGDSQIQVGVRNVFNKPPPFDINQSDANNYISPVGDPRMATYYLSFSRKL
jgi:iron complex outermembrane recepter protein